MAIPPVYTTNFDHLDLSKKRSFVQLLSPEQMVSWGWRVPSETVCHLAKGWNSPHLCFSLCALCVHCILNMFFSAHLDMCGNQLRKTMQASAVYGNHCVSLCHPWPIHCHLFVPVCAHLHRSIPPWIKKKSRKR